MLQAMMQERRCPVFSHVGMQENVDSVFTPGAGVQIQDAHQVGTTVYSQPFPLGKTDEVSPTEYDR